jgi:outer membrane receptor for ferric coprogen and ferric-rhodotorulic acid
MVRTRCSVSLTVVLLLLTAAASVSAQSASLSGRVLAAETGQAVADARLAIEGTGRSATTGADGGFTFPGFAPGVYTLVVEREGFETLRTEIAVQAGVVAPIEVQLPFALNVEEGVTVVGRTVGDLGLAGRASSASRLDLRPLDLPVSIDILDSAVMEARGYQKVSDAVGRMAGVVSGEHATAPSTFSMRGFTASQVATLRDGIWLGPSTMVMRPQNTFNLDRIEVMRGPSSAVNGQGAVAGAINAVTKGAEPTAATRWNALLSYGSFNSSHAAVGVA